MSGALKLSIFSIVGILVFCIVGIFIPPVLLLSEAFSILCCIAISVSVISNIETNGENFLLKLSLALLISAGIQFVMRVIFYILGKNDLFSFCVNSASAILALLSFTATIFIMLVWLILKIFRIPADIIRSTPAGMKVKETKSVMEEVAKTIPKPARNNNSLRLTLKEIFLQSMTTANIIVAKRNL